MSSADADGKVLCAVISKIGHLTAAYAGVRSHDCHWTTAGHTIRIANLYGPLEEHVPAKCKSLHPQVARL